jgi:hypothetical protein
VPLALFTQGFFLPKPKVKPMQYADREKHSTCKQEAPQTFGETCEHMIDPCEEAE